jgi:hypothetical protein
MGKKELLIFTIVNIILILENIGSFYYGEQHPMKPIHIKMAHQLIVNYGLYRKMEVYEPH